MSVSTLTSMTWRRALKHFGKAPPVSPIDISPILKAAALAPTSFGIQPFQIYVVTSDEIKAKILPAAYHQPQITECSHLLIFAARKDALGSIERCISAHQFDQRAPDLAKMIRGSLGTMSSVDFLKYSSEQAFIALGFSLVAAADLRIGSCPMGGFNSEAVGSLIGLPDNESVAVLLAIGVVPETSENLNKVEHSKYRLPIADIVTYL